MAVCATCLTGGIRDMTKHACPTPQPQPQPQPHWMITQYQVSLLPEDHELRRHYTLTVDYSNREGLWHISDGAYRLARDGKLEHQRPASRDHAEWHEAFYFDLSTALDLAATVSHGMVSMGRHVLDVLKESSDE